MRRAIAAACLALCPTIATAKLECAMEDATRKVFCVEMATLREGVGKHMTLRSARLYSGSERSVSDSKMNLIVECNSRVLVLQDTDGVNIGGGRARDSAHLATLATTLCDATGAKRDRNLRQFGH